MPATAWVLAAALAAASCTTADTEIRTGGTVEMTVAVEAD